MFLENFTHKLDDKTKKELDEFFGGEIMIKEKNTEPDGTNPPLKNPCPRVPTENLFNELDDSMKAKLKLLFGEVEIRRKK